MKHDSRTRIVTTSTELAEVCRHLTDAGSFAFDTEFVGEDNYEPETCLIQAATDSVCALIDPLGGLDPSSFWELVADETVQVIVHAGAEDLAQCLKRIGKPAANVFDLQIAAGFMGLGYPASLTRLARVTVGKKIHKSQTLTDWRKRPLSPEQIDYAAEDVIHLPAMYRHIHDCLVRSGRDGWALEECASACRSAATTARGEQKLRRLRGVKSMSGRELAIADALLEERDTLAREYGRPPRSVLRDHLLVEMARRGWTSVSRIRSLRGLNLNTAAVRRLAAVIEKAGCLPEDQWPHVPSDEDSREEEVLRFLMAAVLRDHCHHNDISYALVASKEDLRAVVRAYTRAAEPELPILLKTGWRQAAVGELVDRILSGRCAVRVIQDGDGRRLGTE